jgi:hypothetical protein
MHLHTNNELQSAIRGAALPPLHSKDRTHKMHLQTNNELQGAIRGAALPPLHSKKKSQHIVHFW